jgi:uncharacterized membrane protein YfcA
MFDLTLLSFAIIILCGLLVGFTKTGIPGVGILVIPLMASVFPARASTGILLPMLVMGDVLAVAYYRQHARLPVLLKIIPFTLVGVLAGYLALRVINDTEMNYLIGSIVLILVILTLLQEVKLIPDRAIPKNILFAAVLGLLAGFTTMVANAAGPIIIVYLLAMNLDKEEFIGTGSWYYLLVNAFKIPFSWSLGLITQESLIFDVKLFAFILLGAVLGIYTIHRISPKQFRFAAIALSAAASIKMFF